MSTTVTPPAAPTPTTQAPTAPDVSLSGAEGVTDDILASITNDAVNKTIAEQEPTGSPDRDEKGRFVPKQEAAPVEGQPAADAEPETEPVVLPEGMAAVKKIEGRELVAQFKVLDNDGELEVPDITLEFEANGKTRREPIDKVVKLAQMGVYNHEREQRLAQTQQQIQEKEGQVQQWEARARQVEQDRERLLSDPDYLVQELTRYEQQNTPEARLTREREQFTAQKAQMEFQQVSAQGSRFFESEIIPAVETITKALPYVSEEEIAARLILLTERHKVQTPLGAIVPPNAYQRIKDAVLSDVVPWAQQVNESRETERKAATEQSRKEAEDAKAKAKQAQVTAQQKTNLIGRTVKPGTRTPNGSSAREQPKPKPIVTVEDAEESALREALAASI